MAEEERQRRRMLGRMRQYLLRHRSPRSLLSAIMALTALAGFGFSFGLLKLGLGQMWLRYPLAVLGAWIVFLLLVRAWAEREHAEIRMDEQFVELGPKDDIFDGKPGRNVLSDGENRGRWWDWFDWLNPFEFLDAEAAGCLVGLVVVILIFALGGAVMAIGGLIVHAEVLLAEVLLDVLLVSALNKRLHKLDERWWLSGVMGQTVGPVVITMAFLMAAGYLMQLYAPEADTVGDVWRRWREVR